ncbi:hypothetical protein CY34DRAFT_17962 [Suillus luteus UH-Slu-Lm8-n1]|uniref:Uncharacterized protein n=1 Tax=Suillus luteus UH-Slu-Lm8-n1 TaxID=930992 RepID=A0A0C9ZXE8_9AGAM|nr:hypothetical protein CY34DRAFT_17962 [Suillus luteus UH-Slu-Lm8-n1]
MSWPAFLYDKYTADQENLEEGLFKSTLLLQAFKAIFTSPSSARDVAGDGDAANIIEANRRAKKDIYSSKKVKTHVAQIIKMHNVTPRAIAFTIRDKLRFALSSVTSWRSVDGDFDYVLFWKNIVDFFERAPGRASRQKVKRLLAWWSRKVFGTSQRAELTEGVKARMSVNALAKQRALKALFCFSHIALLRTGGDAANTIEGNQRTKRISILERKSRYLAQCIKMRTVTPHSIADVSCQTSLDSRSHSPSPTVVSSNDGASLFVPPSPTLSTQSSVHFATSLSLRDNKPDERNGYSSLHLLGSPMDKLSAHHRKSSNAAFASSHEGHSSLDETEPDPNRSWASPHIRMSAAAIYYSDEIKQRKLETSLT